MSRKRPIITAAVATLLYLAVWLAMRSCSNSPWPGGWEQSNTYFTSYASQIRNLDPAACNYQHEIAILSSTVEPALAYHYLKRPYQLIPQLLTEIPVPEYYDREGNRLAGDPPPEKVARAEYLLKISPGIKYQPHPCFSRDSRPVTATPTAPRDFAPAATRELTAEDFRIAMVRMCDPAVTAVTYSLFASLIDGMDECAEALKHAPPEPDYRKFTIRGCQTLDAHTLKFTLTRKYPHFLYWLAMPYAAPIPYEALEFYRRPDVQSAGLSWGRYPVGTGPFMIEEADFNSRIIMVRNPEFRRELYPDAGEAGDRDNGLLEDAGKPLPFLDRIVYNLERETIPNWIKFQQGYYDHSGLPGDMFDNAVAMQPGSGEISISPEMAAKGMKLNTTTPPYSYYFSFNMLDPVVGGLTPEKRALRQALSIVLDTSEYVVIFRNGNAIPAQGLIPPAITGYANPPAKFNQVINRWDAEKQKCVRRPLEDAHRLMAAAGYPGGVDPVTGKPLVIHLDHSAAGMPNFKNRFQWLAARFKMLGVTLEERPADLNRTREKLVAGNWQMLFERGWVADYPDPENFLALLFSSNGHVATGGRGANYTNYSSPAYDALFRKLETMPDSPERLGLIDAAAALLAEDAPMIWAYHPTNTFLTHGWLHNYKPHGVAYDTTKYLRIDCQQRSQLLKLWNRPVTLPLWGLPIFVAIVLLPLRKRRKSL